MSSYAKVIVSGSPITKSNFKLHNLNGRAILPSESGKYYDRYALYEQEIAYTARLQNPNVVLDESLIAILKVYYKSQKRHPDTINITKSIFDGIEKSGLIVNDAQILSTKVDGTILVVRESKSKIDNVVEAKELLMNVGANIIGVVLNDRKVNTKKYYTYR